MDNNLEQKLLELKDLFYYSYFYNNGKALISCIKEIFELLNIPCFSVGYHKYNYNKYIIYSDEVRPKNAIIRFGIPIIMHYINVEIKFPDNFPYKLKKSKNFYKYINGDKIDIKNFIKYVEKEDKTNRIEPIIFVVYTNIEKMNSDILEFQMTVFDY